MIALSADQFNGTIILDVSGGNGGSTGDPSEDCGTGGGGGGGAVSIKQSNAPGNALFATMAGGNNGRVLKDNSSYGAMPGCEGSMIYGLIFPEGNSVPSVHANAGLDKTICSGDGVQLLASGGAHYQWRPATGLSCIECADPIASPLSTTTYLVMAFTDEGCWDTDSVTVFVRPSAGVVRGAIPRDRHCQPGDIITLPVMLEKISGTIQVHSVELTVGYSADMLRLQRATTDGTFAQDWTMQIINQQADKRTVRLTAPPGSYFDGSSALLNLEFQTFLGYAQESEIPLTIVIADTGCTTVIAQPGHLALSICGLPFRLIESSESNYTLDQNRPNPFNPSTEIDFSLGLAGQTTLEIIDMRGVCLVTLVNEYLQPGRHTVFWDASNQPSGLYSYRLHSGEWSASGTMVLMK
jgi:hypothetical protein